MVGGKDQAEEVSHRLTLALNHIGIRVNQIEAFARLKKGGSKLQHGSPKRLFASIAVN